MKIAVVGGGISGLGAALALAETHDVRLYEAEARLGGHARTVEVAYPDGVQPVDVGYIVYNRRNYPNLTALFDHLGVETQWSDMSFGFSLGDGAYEYACDDLDRLFAERRRCFDPRHLATLVEILRFNRVAKRDLAEGRLDGFSLGDWLDARGFSTRFRERFLLPMGGAIWSTPTGAMLRFPAIHFVRFFANHDLMTGLDSAERWRTVSGGSREYVVRVRARLGDRAVTGRRVVAVAGFDGRGGPDAALGAGRGRPAALRFADGASERVDAVILACHAPQARALLQAGGAPDPETDAYLSACRTSTNEAVLHADARLMPRRRKVWSSWNFLATGDDAARPAPVTYWMNRLQGIDPARPLFVSLNPGRAPDPALVHARFSFDHPLYDEASFAAQRGIDGVQGRGGVWFAGAWLGYGFHEDGLRSGLRVAAALGGRPAWARETGVPFERPVVAAE